MNSVICSRDLLNASLAEIQDFAPEIEGDISSNFSDGFSDGENNFEPVLYQWSDPDYRRGYIAGMAQRIGIEYALIYDTEMNRVIFV